MRAFPFGWTIPARVEADPMPQRRARPKVGLALGAGAARGWSQLGILQELLANGFAPDIVAGTSIGAVVGGCFCAGRLDHLEAFALSLNRRRVFGLMDFTLSGLGLLAGGRLKARLDRDLGDTAIENLPIRFASVATEVHTGHEIWLNRGRLVDAVRASYALPGLFEPVHVDGRWLIDGALVNPIPISVCRAMGADIVIAVNLVAENPARHKAAPEAQPFVADEPAPSAAGGRTARWWAMGGMARPQAAASVRTTAPRIASVLVDAFNITQDRIARSRLAGDPPDILINAKVGNIGLFEFQRAAELIAIGREATRKAMPDLQSYLDLYPAAVANGGS